MPKIDTTDAMFDALSEATRKMFKDDGKSHELTPEGEKVVEILFGKEASRMAQGLSEAKKEHNVVSPLVIP